MESERASELLYDTASTLRLVDAELGELAPRRRTPPATDADATTLHLNDRVLPLLPVIFARAMGEVHSMLASLRSGREQIRSAATDRIADTSVKLDEVSNATGKAALDIMDSLDRAISMVDQLEVEPALNDPVAAAALRSGLRDELFAVMNHMQFQDITAQQIMHVQSLLGDMEERLTEIANSFDITSGDVRPAPVDAQVTSARAQSSSFDPNATLDEAEARQALADSLVKHGTSS